LNDTTFTTKLPVIYVLIHLYRYERSAENLDEEILAMLLSTLDPKADHMVLERAKE